MCIPFFKFSTHHFTYRRTFLHENLLTASAADRSDLAERLFRLRRDRGAFRERGTPRPTGGAGQQKSPPPCQTDQGPRTIPRDHPGGDHAGRLLRQRIRRRQLCRSADRRALACGRSDQPRHDPHDLAGTRDADPILLHTGARRACAEARGDEKSRGALALDGGHHRHAVHAFPPHRLAAVRLDQRRAAPLRH